MRVRDMAADAARHMAEIAADGSGGGCDPYVQDAMSTWMAAVAAANRAEAEHHSGGGQAAQDDVRNRTG